MEQAKNEDNVTSFPRLPWEVERILAISRAENLIEGIPAHALGDQLVRKMLINQANPDEIIAEAHRRLRSV
jgi:hypothetical protein